MKRLFAAPLLAVLLLLSTGGIATASPETSQAYYSYYPPGGGVCTFVGWHGYNLYSYPVAYTDFSNTTCSRSIVYLVYYDGSYVQIDDYADGGNNVAVAGPQNAYPLNSRHQVCKMPETYCSSLPWWHV